MPQPWMKMELDTPDKPEVHQIAEILKIDPDAVVGKLARVWGWFNKNSVDGIEPIETMNLLNRLVFNNQFCNAMIKVKWMTANKRSGTVQIPKFKLHNSKGAKARALGARRQDVHKIKKQVMSELSNGKVTLKKLLEENRLEKITIDSNSPSSDVPTELYVPIIDPKELDYE